MANKVYFKEEPVIDDDSSAPAPGQGPGFTPEPEKQGFFKAHKREVLITVIGLAIIGLTLGYFAWANSWQSAQQTTVLPTRSPTPTPTPEETPTPTPTATPAPSATPAPTPTPVAVHCKNGQYASSVGKSSCSYTFQVTEVPARFQASSVQASPRQQLYSGVEMTAVCVEDNACQKFSGGAVTSETGPSIDWKITKATQIAITSKETFPGYLFSAFEYDHPAGPICTEEHLYCYNLINAYSAQ